MCILERLCGHKMCLNIKDFVSNDPRAFKNFGITENDLFR